MKFWQTIVANLAFNSDSPEYLQHWQKNAQHVADWWSHLCIGTPTEVKLGDLHSSNCTAGKQQWRYGCLQCITWVPSTCFLNNSSHKSTAETFQMDVFAL